LAGVGLVREVIEQALLTRPRHSLGMQRPEGWGDLITVPYVKAAQEHARQEAASTFGQGQKTDRFRYIGRDAGPESLDRLTRLRLGGALSQFLEVAMETRMLFDAGGGSLRNSLSSLW
jgi:hypothetical protein